MPKANDRRRCVKRLKAFMERPEVQSMSELERLRLAEKELGLRPKSCPLCDAAGCAGCAYEGVVYVLREEN